MNKYHLIYNYLKIHIKKDCANLITYSLYLSDLQTTINHLDSRIPQERYRNLSFRNFVYVAVGWLEPLYWPTPDYSLYQTLYYKNRDKVMFRLFQENGGRVYSSRKLKNGLIQIFKGY